MSDREDAEQRFDGRNERMAQRRRAHARRIGVLSKAQKKRRRRDVVAGLFTVAGVSLGVLALNLLFVACVVTVVVVILKLFNVV